MDPCLFLLEHLFFLSHRKNPLGNVGGWHKPSNMFFGTLKLHGHSDILSLGVNWSDPKTSPTTNHKFIRTLGQLHGPRCNHPLPPLFEAFYVGQTRGNTLVCENPLSPSQQKVTIIPFATTSAPTPNSTPLHFTSLDLGQQQNTPRLGRIEAKKATRLLLPTPYIMSSRPPPPCHPHTRHSKTRALIPRTLHQNKTKQNKQTTPHQTQKKTNTLAALGGSLRPPLFTLFLFHSVPFRVATHCRSLSRAPWFKCLESCNLRKWTANEWFRLVWRVLLLVVVVVEEEWWWPPPSVCLYLYLYVEREGKYKYKAVV
jgi:hypothetical protein